MQSRRSCRCSLGEDHGTTREKSTDPIDMSPKISHKTLGSNRHNAVRTTGLLVHVSGRCGSILARILGIGDAHLTDFLVPLSSSTSSKQSTVITIAHHQKPFTIVPSPCRDQVSPMHFSTSSTLFTGVSVRPGTPQVPSWLMRTSNFSSKLWQVKDPLCLWKEMVIDKRRWKQQRLQLIYIYIYVYIYICNYI